MLTSILLSRVRFAGARFGRSNGGNIAVLFALSLIPLLSFIGAAIDYSRASRAKSSMQAALDSTSLMLSKDLNSGAITSSQIAIKAPLYFAALYTNTDSSVSPGNIHATYTAKTSSGTSTIVVTNSGYVVTDFLQIAGFPKLNIDAASTASWGSTKLRVAMVLDNTYSMASDGKMAAMQTAAKNLVDTLSAQAASNGDVYISIIPFNVDVNIGVSNKTQAWLDWNVWDADEGSCSSTTYTTAGNCTSHGKTWNNNRGNWTGCVQDRTASGSYDVVSLEPITSNISTMFQPVREDFYYGYFGDPCPQQVMPMSYDWTALKTKITAMAPNGTTNQTIGLHWGWLSLLQQLPLSAPPEDINATYKRIIILLSDGDNTANRTYPWDGTGAYPSQTTISAIDARQKLLCYNIKASAGGVEIYTIQVNTDGTANSTVMQYCASGTSNFFSTTSASGITAAFSSIGTSLSKLRVSN